MQWVCHSIKLPTLIATVQEFGAVNEQSHLNTSLLSYMYFM